LRDCVVRLLAKTEGALEFVGQGIEFDLEEVEGLRLRAVEMVRDLLERGRRGERIREGVRVAIVGAPNSGKSSLFNRLIGREKAIVSASEGTTRDLVEGVLEVEGVRVVLIDTAGIRETRDTVEAEGVRRAMAAAEGADRAILLWPADNPDEDGEPRAFGDAEFFRVVSKADLEDLGKGSGRREGWLRVSAVTGEGIEELRSRLAGGGAEGVGDVAAIGRRQKKCLEEGLKELEGCNFNELELAAEGLRNALGRMEEVSGRVTSEEVLDEVFGSFCIGK
jgi:tRNA modification GTPase